MSSVSDSPSRPTTPRDSDDLSQRISGETSRDISEMTSVLGHGDSDEKAAQEESEGRNTEISEKQENLLYAMPPVYHQLIGGEGDANIVESMSVSMV